MQDPAKIAAKITTLGADWVDAQGYHALTTMEYGIGVTPVFNPGNGIPLKTFVNTKTGEVKIFLAKDFEVDD